MTTYTKDIDEFGFVTYKQEFTSKLTAHGNGKANGGTGRVPALFTNSNVKFNSGTINFDYGCGEYTTANKVTEFLANKNVICIGYDKYNKTDIENKEAIKQLITLGRADTITCANVLNVIKERYIRVNEVIYNIYNLLKQNGIAYFDVYTDKKQAGPKQTGTDKYQLFKEATSYFGEVAEIFGENNIQIKGKVIIAHKL